MNVRRQRRAWRKAQAIHAMEHEVNLPLSLSCTAVGHYEAIDEYKDLFDRDTRRKFMVEYRGVVI